MNMQSFYTQHGNWWHTHSHPHNFWYTQQLIMFVIAICLVKSAGWCVSILFHFHCTTDKNHAVHMALHAIDGNESHSVSWTCAPLTVAHLFRFDRMNVCKFTHIVYYIRGVCALLIFVAYRFVHVRLPTICTLYNVDGESTFWIHGYA